MGPEQPSTETGTICISFEMPNPWPVTHPTIIFEAALVGGEALLACLPKGTMGAALAASEDGKRSILDQRETPVLRFAERQPLIVSIGWENARIISFDLNGSDLLTGAPNLELGPVRFQAGPPPDYTDANERARLTRYSVVKNLPINPRRKEGGAEYLFASLQGEIVQIEDLIDLIKKGREAHVPGLASRLRLLLAGKPLGLLQHCAALKKAPLLVYTNRAPESLPPIAGAIAIFESARAEPSSVEPCAVDIDVWLKFPALQVGERVYSHIAAIKEIGDTIGSHRDAGIPEAVRMRQIMKTQNSNTYRDIQRYLLDVAEAVLAVSRRLLSTPASL